MIGRTESRFFGKNFHVVNEDSSEGKQDSSGSDSSHPSVSPLLGGIESVLKTKMRYQSSSTSVKSEEGKKV